MIYYWLTYSRAPVNVVDLTPSTGKKGRPYSKNWQGIGDIIFVASTHVESVVMMSRKD